MSLKELRWKRLKWVEANRENDFEEGIGRLLTELYPDNAHFIYELLQNAEDAKATEVRFILKEDGVEFEHNGSQLFTLEDVKSITSIGVSTKKDDPTNIGKFGVGFKAVFAYTNTPEITSGKYHFRIRDLVVPDTEGLSPCALGEKETHFSFPFDSPQKPPENARTEIEKNLRQLDESTLLFLNNIRKIEYLLPDSSLGFLERRETDGNRIEILVQHPEDSEPASVFFLRFEKAVNVNDEDGKPKPCRIAIAFGLEEEEREEGAKKSDKRPNQPSTIQWRIQSLEPGRVSIYFPAEKETSNLRFDLHAPFASTVARDSVRDCEANDELRDHLADLIAESMTAIRDQGLLTVGFLATLPNNRDNLSPFYKPILDRLVKAFQNESLTPMRRGGHAAATGIFRGPARLSDLIIDADLATLLGEEYSSPLWIANPPQINQREHNFLSMLDISEWTTDDLIRRLEDLLNSSEWTTDEEFISRLNDLDEDDQAEQITEWLSEKSDKWHGRLYSLLGDELLDDDGYFDDDDYRELFLHLPIVRISDRTYRKGGDCFFPDEDVEHDQTFPRVAKGVCSSKKIRKFLKAIDVREVGKAEQVEEILKQRYSEGSINPRKKDMKSFIEFIEDEPEQANLFSTYYIFELEDENWGKPGQVFLDSPYLNTGLRAYYEALGDGSGRKWALSPNYKKAGIALKRIAEFVKKVGVQTKLKLQQQSIPYTHPEKSKLQDSGGWSWSYGINVDYDIPEFNVLLAGPALGKSKLIWETMNELPDDPLEARYCSNSRHYTKTANSSLVWKLRTKSWIPQKQNAEGKFLFVKPSDAVVELLPSGFQFDSGAKWLESIEFGKAKREQEEQERRKKEQATQEYQWKSKAAETLGFPSVEVAQKMARISKEDPEFISEFVSKWEGAKQKPIFPERSSQNPERRRKKVSQQYADSSEKKYEQRKRSVRVTEATSYTRTWLKNQYTNESNQMICQICKEEMPFKKRNDEYYFEAVEALSKEHFNKEHEAQFLALCPECAARYKEFVKNDGNVMQKVKNKLANSAGLEIPLQLGNLETNIRFVEIHRQDMKTILQN